ncbi:S-protein homolog 2-like [Pyrus x bretschneideri]|uniref:S-protein homolog 2-like n=1 Tax=Pyrus x bretschneideri TaxID=225117 RepID=UPI00202E5DC0|nr:S-protein homolog 2-like [Pyrus x bretschneideri]
METDGKYMRSTGTKSKAKKTSFADRVLVEIINGVMVDLNAHCKSKDDDLGLQKLRGDSPIGIFRFSFVPNIWGTTLYHCSFAWKQESHHFDIFVSKRDEGKCRSCSWVILADKPCRFNDTSHQFDICYPWKDPVSLHNYIHI